MKKILALLLCLVIFCSGSVFAEEKPITVLIDGAELSVPVAPVIVNSRTMLPMRAIFEALGAKVSWAGGDQLIFATRGSSLLVLQIGTPFMSVQTVSSNENISVPLDAAPYLHDGGHTMVPVRAIAEALKANVEWDGVNRAVIITQN